VLVVALPAVGLVAGPRAAQGAGTGPAPDGSQPLRVYVLTVDGLHPDEVATYMPNLAAIQAESRSFGNARAVLPAETLPNHVAMMTGVLPRDSGIVANEVWTPGSAEEEADSNSADPSLLRADTLVTMLERDCLGGISTATVQPKRYTELILNGESANPGDPKPQRQADLHWNTETYPRKNEMYIPVSDHVIDDASMTTFLDDFVGQPEAYPTPHFAFVSLADVDRTGHTDEGGVIGGTATAPTRLAAMARADGLIQDLVDDLVARRAWNDTVLIVTSDHSMDWSEPDAYVDLEAPLLDAGFRLGRDLAADDAYVVNSGGAALVYVHDDARIPEVAGLLEGVDGVERLVSGTTTPDREQVGIDDPAGRGGDLLVLAQDGRRMSTDQDSGPDDRNFNPIPGNHSHGPTQPSTLIVAGGHPALRTRGPDGAYTAVANQRTGQSSEVYSAADPDRLAPPASGVGNLSVAPTVASLFGLPQSRAFPSPFAQAPLADAFDAGAFAALPDLCEGPPPAEPTETGSEGSRTETMRPSPPPSPPASSPSPASPAPSPASSPASSPPPTPSPSPTPAASAPPSPAPTAAPVELLRLAGADRWATSAAISRATFAPGVGVAYVTTGATFADALAAGPVATLDDAPVLLTDPLRLPQSVADELTRLAPDRVVLVGGSEAVTAGTAEAIGRAAAAPVERVFGPDRFATAAALAQRFPPGAPVSVATGETFPDALAGGVAAAEAQGPILLVARDAVPEATRAAVERLAPSELTVLGGAQAIDGTVEAELEQMAGSEARRLAGADRFATSVAISQASRPAGAETVFVATGATFPDALVGVPVAARADAPILLIGGDLAQPAVLAEVERLGARRVVVLGGLGAVSDEAAAAVRAIVDGR